MQIEFKNIPDFKERCILENDTFICVPTIGPLVEGHCLIFSKRDVINISQLTPKEKADLNDLKDIICSSVAKVYQTDNILLFEQGAINKSTAVGCGVDIAHLHIVPFVQGEKIISIFENNHKKIHSYPSLEGFLSEETIYYDQPYVLLGHWKNKFSTYSYGNIRESQIVRRVMSEVLNIQEWDWKKMNNEHLMWETFDKLKA